MICKPKTMLHFFPFYFTAWKHQADAFRCFMRGKCEGSSSYFSPLSYRLSCTVRVALLCYQWFFQPSTEEVINERPATLPLLFKTHFSSSVLLMPLIFASPAYFIFLCAFVLSLLLTQAVIASPALVSFLSVSSPLSLGCRYLSVISALLLPHCICTFTIKRNNR